MTEKLPQFKRPEPKIVGAASLEEKERHKKNILERFGERHYKQFPEEHWKVLESLDYKKEPYEKLAIKQANDITNDLLSEFNLTPFDIPERNIHILPGSFYTKMDTDRNNVAMTFHDLQLIALNADVLSHPFDRAKAILHEITHLKEFTALEAVGDKYKPYRNGLQISSAQKKKEKTGFFTAFKGLNEAVVSEIERTYFEKLVNENPYLKEDYNYWGESEERQQLYEECKEEVAKVKSRRPKDVSWISKDGKKFGFFSRCGERKALDFIVDRLYADNNEKYETRDDVMKLFFKALFSGRLLEIAGLTEKSFGKGSFRMIGMMNDPNSVSMVMDYLTKHKK